MNRTTIAGPRLRHRRVCQSARIMLTNAVYEAFTRSHRGKKAMHQMRAVKAGVMAAATVDKLQARGKRGTLEPHLFIQNQIGDMLEGRGTVDTLSLLHSWMGHMFFCCVARRKNYKPGHVERAWLNHSIRQLCAGRRATYFAWLRFKRTQKIGFTGQELQAFKQGCAEAFFVAERVSKVEMRDAYAFADAKAKRQGLAIELATM